MRALLALPQGQRRRSRLPGTYMTRRLAVSTVALVGVLIVTVLAGCTPQSAATPAPSSVPYAPLPVVKYVDGDTIKVPGATVRFSGIDIPERGQDCYTQARDHLASLVAGRPVTLTAAPGRDDHDRYGRLLRYVSVDGNDIGLAMIQQGWAIARYDSRDGYGQHPKQSEYVEADARSAPKRCGGAA